MNRTIIFFDIDGTLLDTHGAGREAFARTMQAVLGDDRGLEQISFSGATDRAVFDQLMSTRNQPPTPELRAAFFECLPRIMEQTLTEFPLSVFPGVAELLRTLAARDDVLLGLVTGNIESCAWLKVGAADLAEYFTFGGFGCEHADRAEIARRAIGKIEHSASPGHRDRPAIFLVGDTPSDIRAARAIGARSIAVTTGQWDKEALAQAGAEHIVADLSGRDGILNILGLTKHGQAYAG